MSNPPLTSLTDHIISINVFLILHNKFISPVPSLSLVDLAPPSPPAPQPPTIPLLVLLPLFGTLSIYFSQSIHINLVKHEIIIIKHYKILLHWPYCAQFLALPGDPSALNTWYFTLYILLLFRSYFLYTQTTWNHTTHQGWKLLVGIARQLF